jgi:DNA repair photolyase
MGKIYVPTGKAREYSPQAANFFDGCDHGCAYCYAPNIRRTTRDKFLEVKLFKSGLPDFEKSCKERRGKCTQVLFNFIGDPYCDFDKKGDTSVTRQALEIALDNKIPIAILSKGGERILRDLDLFSMFGPNVKIGATLTFSTAEKSLEWEPGAATPDDRLNALKICHDKQIKTWASFEPVIDPNESLAVMERSLPYVDVFKVGKINNFRGLDETIDWTSFLSTAVKILRDAGKGFYIKKDLREAAPSIRLYGSEVMHDDFALPSWVEE